MVRAPLPHFSVNDDFNCESLRIEAASCLPLQRMVRSRDKLVELRGASPRLHSDNGPEIISAALWQWAQRPGVGLLYIQPGNPVQDACIECFNRTLRTPRFWIASPSPACMRYAA